MDATSGWNSISTTQQNQFLQQTNLASLPAMEAMTPAQWNVLAGIAGEETVATLQDQYAVGESLADPVLPAAKKEVADWSNIMMLVTAMSMQVSELQIGASVEKVEADAVELEAIHTERAQQLQENIENLRSSAASGLAGKIFGWIGAALGLIGAAVATALTGGAAAPALVVAALSVTTMALQETGAMEKIVSFVAENPAVMMAAFPVLGAVLTGLVKGGVLDEEQAKSFVSATFSVAMIAASVACAVLSFGATAASSVTLISSQVTSVLKVVGAGSQVAASVAQVGQGASGVAGAAYDYKSAMIQADTADTRAALEQLQSMLNEEAERLQQLLETLNSGVQSASSILNEIKSSNQAIFQNMGM